jgi:hypothetical protein
LINELVHPHGRTSASGNTDSLKPPPSWIMEASLGATLPATAVKIIDVEIDGHLK